MARSPRENPSGLNDGAAALLVTSAERARDLGLALLARVVSTGVAPHTVEPTGNNFVPPAAAELAARVKHGHHHLER